MIDSASSSLISNCDSSELNSSSNAIINSTKSKESALRSSVKEASGTTLSVSTLNFSATTGIVSARPDLYGGAHKHPGYSVSKAGVINLTKFLAVHLAPKIRVNCVAPGYMLTDMTSSLKGEKLKSVERRAPLGLPGTINAAHAVLFLLEDAAEKTTGSIVTVDGGATA